MTSVHTNVNSVFQRPVAGWNIYYECLGTMW